MYIFTIHQKIKVQIKLNHLNINKMKKNELKYIHVFICFRDEIKNYGLLI